MSSRMRAVLGALALIGASLALVWCGPDGPSPVTTTTTTTLTFAVGNPVADCGGSYGVVQAGRQVTFSGTKSTTPNPPLSYSWDPGDGTARLSGATPTHTYEKCKLGTSGCFVQKKYKVSLTVTDAAGRSASCETTCEVSGLY
jgi:PKD repeat protein